MSRRIDSPVPDGTVLFMTSAWSASAGRLLDHRHHARQVGVAGVGGRRVDAAEEQPGVAEQLVHRGREVEAIGVLDDELARGRARGT